MTQSNTNKGNKAKLIEAINKLVSEFNNGYQYDDTTFCYITIDLVYDIQNRKWSCSTIDLNYPVVRVDRG